MKNFKNQKGFTLLELLIVIVVLALIITTGYSYIKNSYQDSTEAVMAINIASHEKDIVNAFKLYQHRKGTNPTNIAELVSEALLMTIPKPPTNSQSTAGDYTLNTNRTLEGTSYITVELTNVKDNICKKINASAGLDPATYGPGKTTTTTNAITTCFDIDTNSTNNNNIVTSIITKN